MTVAARATPATVKMMRRARAAVFMLAIWNVSMGVLCRVGDEDWVVVMDVSREVVAVLMEGANGFKQRCSVSVIHILGH